MKTQFVSSLVMGVLLAFVSLQASADAGDSATLKRIQDRGYVSIGHRETSIPFSYVGNSVDPIGYTIDICMKIIDAIRVELGNDNIFIKYVPITGQTRIPLMANGTIDLECGSTTNSLKRQKQVDYLFTTFVTGTKIASKKGSGINEVEDLDGKTVGLSYGTTTDHSARALIAELGLNVKVLPVKGHKQGWLALEGGRIDAYMADDVLLYGRISKSKNPSNYQVTGRYLSYDPYSIMVPRNDSTFARLGRVVMANLMRSGEMEALYAKWFEPGPTKINIPLTNMLKTAFRLQSLPE